MSKLFLVQAEVAYRSARQALIRAEKQACSPEAIDSLKRARHFADKLKTLAEKGKDEDAKVYGQALTMHAKLVEQIASVDKECDRS